MHYYDLESVHNKVNIFHSTKESIQVTCSKCGNSNPTNSNFCVKCGSILSPTCSKCELNNPISDRTTYNIAKPFIPISNVISSVSHKSVLGSFDGCLAFDGLKFNTLRVALQSSATPPPVFSTAIFRYFLCKYSCILCPLVSYVGFK